MEEETGYKGKFICFTSKYFGKNENVDKELKIGGNIYFDPWNSSDNAIQYIVEIDGGKILGKKSQKLDDNELIQIFEFEMDKLMDLIIFSEI